MVGGQRRRSEQGPHLSAEEERVQELCGVESSGADCGIQLLQRWDSWMWASGSGVLDLTVELVSGWPRQATPPRPARWPVPKQGGRWQDGFQGALQLCCADTLGQKAVSTPESHEQ